MRLTMRKSRVILLVLSFFALTVGARAQSLCELEKFDDFWGADSNYQSTLDLYINNYSDCQYECGVNQQLTGSAYDACVQACSETSLSNWRDAQDTLWETADKMTTCVYEMDFCNNATARRANCDTAFPDHMSDPNVAEQWSACVDASGIWSCQ